MSEWPSIFQPAMVRGLISGAKTMTRRFDKKPWSELKPGDQLWVKETFWRFGRWTTPGLTNAKGNLRWQFEPAKPVGGPEIDYIDRFDESHKAKNRTDLGWHKRPSIFMNREFSRITLTVVGTVRENLHDISEADAKAEGAIWHDGGEIHASGWRHDREDGTVWPTAINSFRRLWSRINGGDAWMKNPAVIVTTFTVQIKQTAKRKK